MAMGQVSRIVEHLRRVVLPEGGELSDGRLLERFLTQQDDAAFTALVKRHGPMVLGVCRRILRNAHDADDAFQATFLVLVRKAPSLLSRDNIGNWLYGVAHNTALKARAMACKRWEKERQATIPQSDDTWRELLPVLDQELSRLPELYREPVVLCDLEGKTRKEAARQLGLPEGTLSTRLDRARSKLAQRLTRHGAVLSAGAITIALTQNAAAACVPAALTDATVKAAALLAAGETATAGLISANVLALTEGVLTAMFWTKIKITTAVLLTLGLLGTGTGVLTYQAFAQKEAKAPIKEQAPIKKQQAGDGSEISGEVKSIDAAQKTITVQEGKKEKGGGAGQTTFSIAADAKVLIDDGTGDKTGVQVGTLGDVKEGVFATLRLDADRKTVTRIHVEGPTVHGILKSVDSTANSVTVAVDTGGKGAAPADKTYPIAKDARIAIDDGADKSKAKGSSKLSDIPAGAMVVLKLSGDQKAVGSVFAHGQTLHGTLKAVDVNKNTITIGSKDSDQTIAVAADARISIDDNAKGIKSKDGGKGDGKPTNAKLSELTLGAQVTVKLSLDQKAAVQVQAQGQTVGGTLKSVDAAKGTITLLVGAANKGDAPVEQTLEVAKDAIIRIDEGKEGKLSDIPPESHVSVKLAANQKGVVSIQADGPSLSGAIKGNVTGDSITFGGKGGDQTVSVAKSAKVIIDDRREGKLSDLIDGTVVHAKLSADKREVIGIIHAEGPSYQGVVKSVDTNANTITINVGGKKGGGEDKTFTITKDTAIVTGKNALALKLSDVKPDKDVSVRLAIDQKAVLKITLVQE